MKRKWMEIDEYDAALILGALKDKRDKAGDDLMVLNVAKERDLFDHEREELPSTLQRMSREQLLEQIDPWISLIMQYDGIIRDFDYHNWA